jgi:hypothetical protein
MRGWRTPGRNRCRRGRIFPAQDAAAWIPPNRWYNRTTILLCMGLFCTKNESPYPRGLPAYWEARVAGLIPISWAILATIARCCSIEAANSAARPGFTIWPEDRRRAAITGSAAIDLTSAAMRSRMSSARSRCRRGSKRRRRGHRRRKTPLSEQVSVSRTAKAISSHSPARTFDDVLNNMRRKTRY